MALQAIVTRYAGPTNHTGSRIIATTDAGRKSYAWNYALGVEDNHRAAALAELARLGWQDYGTLVTGSLPKQAGYAHTILRSS